MSDRLSSIRPADLLPWYRHPWPWLLIAGPAIVVVAGIATAWIAYRSDDGVVAEDYYKRGLLVNNAIAALPPAAPTVVATVTLDAAGSLRVMPRTADDEDESLAATLTHPASGTREQVTLVRVADGSFSARVSSALGGRWIVAFTPRRGTWPTTLVERSGATAPD